MAVAPTQDLLHGQKAQVWSGEACRPYNAVAHRKDEPTKDADSSVERSNTTFPKSDVGGADSLHTKHLTQ
eukprot:6180170-Pleurochrysis_carterae.AAC.3